MRACARDDGFVTVQFVGVTAFSLVLFVLLANLVLAQYARAALRHAADDAARAASRAASTVVAGQRCRSHADAAVADLLGGALVRDRATTCHLSAHRVEVDVRATVGAWLPLYPPFDVGATATVVREARP